ANSQSKLGVPDAMATGSDGTLWFTDASSIVPRVGKVNPTTGASTFYEVPTTGDVSFAYGQLTSITAGSGGDMWFAGGSSGSVGRITSSGTVTAFATGWAPSAVTVGPDHLVWFTDDQNGAIGRLDPATGNVDTYFPPSAGGNLLLGGIASGQSNALWFTEPGVGKVGRIDADTGNITEYALPTADSAPEGIVAGSDGNVWFTEAAASNIGRITPSGTVTEYPLPSTLSAPMRIISGPDGNLWFTEAGKGTIGHLDPAAPPSGSPHAAAPPILAGGKPRVAAPFQNQCPLGGICITEVTTGGSVKIGSFSQQLPPGAVRVTGSITSLSSGSILNPPVMGQQFVSVPVEVKGGLIGQLPLVGPALGMTPLAELPFNKLTVTQSLAAPITVGVGAGGLEATATVNIQLNNSLLGSSCVIGPITEHLAPTSRTGESAVDVHLGWQPVADEAKSGIAVPAAKGCGPFGILDGIINQMMGLPSAAANSTMDLPLILSTGGGINPANTPLAARTAAVSSQLSKLLDPKRPTLKKKAPKAPKKVTTKVKGITKKLQVR
ncbi:MAG: Streptogramin lyase, partial [Actinomycetia bacterium]|nr:Streptogramin lyase [Actinomycetes bacterium]